jgi:hypothetical protein
MAEETYREQHKVTGEKLLQTVKRLIHEGNARRIIVKDAADRSFLEIPLTVGVVGALMVPVLVAIGAIAALAADYTLEVEKVAESRPAEPAATA